MVEAIQEKAHVVFVHKKMRRLSEDKYIVDMAQTARSCDYKVTILTTEMDESNCLDEVNPDGDDPIPVMYSCRWLPRGFQLLKSFLIALRLLFFPPPPRPKTVIIDNDLVLTYLLTLFTAYKTVFVNHLREFKQLDMFSSCMRITPDFWTAKMMMAPNEVVVYTDEMARIVRRSYPHVETNIRVLTPSVETGLWALPEVDVMRIVPDLPPQRYLFVCFGDYKRRSNFKLALDAFDVLMNLTDPPLKPHLHLVVAGRLNCSDHDETQYYTDLVEKSMSRVSGSQITFLKQLTITHKKSLIKAAVCVIHTTKHDIYSETILAAMSLKRPIIALNAGFLRGVLSHRISAILVDPNPIKFASAMHKMLTSPNVQAFLAEMARDVFDRDFCLDVYRKKVQFMIGQFEMDDNTSADDGEHTLPTQGEHQFDVSARTSWMTAMDAHMEAVESLKLTVQRKDGITVIC